MRINLTEPFRGERVLIAYQDNVCIDQLAECAVLSAPLSSAYRILFTLKYTDE